MMERAAETTRVRIRTNSTMRDRRSRGSAIHTHEHAVCVVIPVEVVRGLRQTEPLVPSGDQLALREIAEVQILLAEKLVAHRAHDRDSGGRFIDR